VPGCLKRYTDPSSLRKHVKNHVAKQQQQHQQQQHQQQQQQPQQQQQQQQQRDPLAADGDADGLGAGVGDRFGGAPAASHYVDGDWTRHVAADLPVDQCVVDDVVADVYGGVVDDAAHLSHAQFVEDSILFNEMGRYIQEDNGGIVRQWIART